MLKIYGADLSAPANKVRFAANAMGLEYEYEQVNIREGQNKTEEYLKMHPAGKIPVINDDGFVLFESSAICRYLARKHHSELYPTDIKEMAEVDQWLDFVAIHVNGALGRVLFNRVFFQFAKVEKDERSLEDGLKFLNRFLPVIENQLKTNRYLAGDKITLADIGLLAALDPVEVAQVDLKDYPAMTKWRNEMKSQDFYTKCYKEYGEILKQAAS